VRLAFEEFVHDSETREVFRAGAPVALSPKAFDLLEPLTSERPKAISKDRSHAELWPRRVRGGDGTTLHESLRSPPSVLGQCPGLPASTLDLTLERRTR